MTTSPLFIPVDTYLVDSLPEVWFGVLMFALAMYVALDGLDFGIGMLLSTRESEDEREILLEAFGPIWDANEVWLVAFGTILLAAFPPVYSALLSQNYTLVIAILFVLILRGIAPELREQRDDRAWKRRWDQAFFAGSLLTPFLLGVLVGTWIFGAGALSLPSLFVGLTVVTLSLFAGAVFLALKTTGSLRDEVARYGRLAAGGYLVAVVAVLATAFATNPHGVRSTILSGPVAAIVVTSIVLVAAGVAFSLRGRDRAWFLSTTAVAFLLVAFVGYLLFPVVYPATGLTLREAVVSPLALNVTTVLGLPVLVVVLLYFRYLYSVFAGPIEQGDGYGTGH